MSGPLRQSGIFLVSAVAALCAFTPPGLGGGADQAARELAERFAQDGTSQGRVAKQRKVEPAPRPTPDEEQRLLDEIEMLERARAEAEARRAAMEAPAYTEAADRGGATGSADLGEMHRATEAAHAAEVSRAAAEARARAEQEAEHARMEAEREAEAERIDEVLRQVRAARAARERAEPLPPGLAGAPPAVIGGPDAVAEHTPVAVQEGAAALDRARPMPAAPADVSRRAEHDQRQATRVTVLIVMEAGDRGIRRHNKTGDPLLCGERGCYVSAGAGTAAEFLPRRRALGAGRTMGERAGACRSSLGCIFRGVDLVAYPAVVQPIDMRLVRHDRRQPQVLSRTSECRIAEGRLACTPIRGPDYVMWVLPEQVAETAGPAVLEAAVAAGLAPPAVWAVSYDR